MTQNLFVKAKVLRPSGFWFRRPRGGSEMLEKNTGDSDGHQF
jgi:hypothetical protein